MAFNPAYSQSPSNPRPYTDYIIEVQADGYDPVRINGAEIAERLGVVNKYYADIERGTCGMSVETLINLSRLYGVSLDTLIYGEKEKQSPVSQGEQLMRGLDRMPQVVQDYCLRMLWLFADGLRAAQEETAEYETVKSSSDSEENSGSED